MLFGRGKKKSIKIANKQADILLISDGRFPENPALTTLIENAKKQHDLRLHGLLLGRWRTHAMAELCAPLHRFDHWQVRDLAFHHKWFS